MNIRNIEAFIYIYHLSSFNKAAEALYLTQPTISARINNLETDLNTTLFHRANRGATLTEEGEKFLPYAYRIYNAYKEAKINVGQEVLNMNLGTITSISTILLPQLITSFQEKYPDVSVNIITGTSKEILNKVIDKKCHLGITQSIRDPRINSMPFHTDPIALVVPHNHHFLSLKRKVTIKDIAFEPLISISHGVHDKETIEKVFAAHNLKPRVAMVVDNIETIKFMVLKGMGISFLPELCFKNELASGELFSVPIDPPLNIKRELEIIYLKKNKVPFLSFFV